MTQIMKYGYMKMNYQNYTNNNIDMIYKDKM